MFKIEAVQTVYNTCTISDEDEQKVLDYIKCNEEEFRFMYDKERIIKAVEELYNDGDIELYGDYVESECSTDEIKRSEFEERTAGEILVAKETEDIISDSTELDKIFHEMFAHFNSHHSNILRSYERTSDEKREKKLNEAYVLINDFLQNGVKPVYYRSEELAIFCLMIKKDWKYLKELQDWSSWG